MPNTLARVVLDNALQEKPNFSQLPPAKVLDRITNGISLSSFPLLFFQIQDIPTWPPGLLMSWLFVGITWD